MSQADRARCFAALHVPGDPVILVNIWDVGSARAVTDAGAKALATASWAVAAAHGHDDGESLPLDLAISNIARIAASVDLPLSADLESGYGVDPATVGTTVARAIEAGAVGCNLEDGIPGDGIHVPADHAARIAAARAAAGVDAFFINARTDLFLRARSEEHASLMDDAIARAAAYASAGASGFFAPGLRDPALIQRLCAEVALPVNIIALPDTPDRATLARLGVARISHGPGAYRRAMTALTESAREALGD